MRVTAVGVLALTLGLRVSVGAQAVSQAQTATVAGPWHGQITLPTTPLNIDVNLSRDAASGAWAGTIDIPAQGAKGARLADVVVNGRAVSFAIAGIPGTPTFVGTVSDDGQSVAGMFTQAVNILPFELRRGVRVAAVPAPRVRPQEPKGPFPYRAENVTYRNTAANVGLAGTLTLPQGSGRVPAVILVSGSGAQDRDSTIAGHRPFLLIADTLTRQGVAVLRVDDRGIGGSERGSGMATTADLADDVRAGLAYLATRADIDATKLGVIGHSEGASIAAMVAADTASVRFIVMLAGAGLPGDQILMAQAAVVGALNGAPKAAFEWDLGMRRRIYDQVLAERDGKPDDAARQRLLDSIPTIPGTADTTAARQLAEQMLRAASLPWMRFFLAYDPRTSFSRVKVPVLAINGDKDLQVAARENVPAIRAALQAAGNANVTIETLPNLNHLLQTAETGAVAEYEQIEETIAPAALAIVSEWVTARAK